MVALAEELLRERLPESTVVRTGPLTIEARTGDRDLRRIDLTRVVADIGTWEEAEQRRHLDELFGEMLAGSSTTEWEDAKQRILPAVRGVAHMFDGLQFRPVADFLCATLVLDLPRTLHFVTAEHVQRWGVDHRQLDRAALANLLDTTPSIEIDAVGGVIRIEGSDVASSWALVPRMLFSISKPLGDFVVLVPEFRRLWLVSTASEEGLQRELQAALDLYVSSPRRLSPVPYRPTPVFVPWTPEAGRPCLRNVRRAVVTLATYSYAATRTMLAPALLRRGDDVWVANHMAIEEEPDGDIYSVATCERQVRRLLPKVDVVRLNDLDTGESMSVAWTDVERLAPGYLRPEPGEALAPRWRVDGWPDSSVLPALRSVAVKYTPPGGSP